jgi:hypothetical protein
MDVRDVLINIAVWWSLGIVAWLIYRLLRLLSDVPATPVCGFEVVPQHDDEKPR